MTEKYQPHADSAAGMLIRDLPDEKAEALGRLMVTVYSTLDGFPSPEEQPDYYQMLANIGSFTQQPETRILVATTPDNRLLGGVLYFGDMKDYGSGGTAPKVKNASGIRLLAVDPVARGMGVGKALTEACIELARNKAHAEVVLHTTQAMQIAWRMYEKMGFKRSEDLDFLQQDLPVFGFRLRL